jgi:hypothetical protein
LFRSAGNRRSDNALSEVGSLWLDEDDGHYPETGPEPTAIIRSSENRRQLYWALDRPVSIEWGIQMNRRIAAWSGGDTTKAGKTSVLRAPGTANYKRHPRVDIIAGFATGVEPWDFEVLDQVVPLIKGAERKKRMGPYTGPPIALEPYLERVEVIRELHDSQGQAYQIVCPWVSEHSNDDQSGTRLGQMQSGACWFYCNHSHCEGRSWGAFKRKVRIGEYRPGYTGPSMAVGS